MKNRILLLMLCAAAAVAATATAAAVPAAHAQEIGGGIDLPGDWWLGEGLKQGDFFSYRLCHVDYKECQEFEADLWIRGDRQVGTESKWLADVVVYDGDKIHKGEFEFGKIAAEPTGGTDNLATYRSAFKSSVSWLSSFATSYEGDGGGKKGPKAFNVPSWGKIANIGGQQVRPMSVESVTVPAGTYDEAIKIGWRTGGASSSVWILDGFPFPVKASTWTHVSEGQPPQEYLISMLEYRENVAQDPFAGIVPSETESAALGCPDNDGLPFASLKKSTKNFAYGLEVLYKPEQPKQGCDIDWLIKFKSKYDETEFLTRVQYDIMVVDDEVSLPPLRSLADENAKQFLYSPSGLAERTMLAREPPGENNYLILVYGLAPEFVVPNTPHDYLLVPITVLENDMSGTGTAPVPPAAGAGPGEGGTPSPQQEETRIPSWVKNNAGLWAGGMIDDNTFVVGLQYLIQERIIVIPDTRQGAGPAGDIRVPGWVKNNAGLWADGMIDDGTFVVGLQYLIENGIVRISAQ